jgi:ATP-dependent Clp protease ATP-binding subunit ClpB
MKQPYRVLDPTQTGSQARSLHEKLSHLVVGQDEAVEQIVNMYQMYVSGLAAPGRPVGNFLFLGPTGSGKTRTVEATAEALTGTRGALIKIDCAEFQHSHEIAKLIGSPPGYLGHRETHPLLSQEVLDQHHTETVKLSFVLFDEIEKASDSLWNLLLGILDKGTLTLGDNRRVDFSRAMIFMTSNLGAAEMNALSAPKLGFERNCGTEKRKEQLGEKMSRTGVAAARRKFTPEFMNRIDKIAVFQPLGEANLGRILDLELEQIRERVRSSSSGKSFVLTVSETGKRFLLEQGTDIRYGARHLKRAMERLVVHPLSNLIATNQVNTGDWIVVDFDCMRKCLLFTTRTDNRAAKTAPHIIGSQSRTSAQAA